jgi:putative Ca2+/H+ antiporter (TMEM165/GDT1 family)
MKDFWAALVFVFLAEMGDKTQFMTLGFAARFKAITVFCGVCVATALINLLSVGMGESFGKTFPAFWVNLCAGLAFIAFGIWTLKGDDHEQTEQRQYGRHGPFMTVVIAFFLAELGDKTMLTAVAVASRYHSFAQVWLGSTVGLVAANSLAIFAGKAMATRLSGRTMKITVAAIYVISGVLAIADALVHH